MNPNHIAVGDPVKASPVGAGKITGITQAGYPQVNSVAVTWLEREDGAVFDPHGRHGGTRGPVAGVPATPHMSNTKNPIDFPAAGATGDGRG